MRGSHFQRLALTVLLFAGAAMLLPGQQTTLSPAERERQVQSFEQVWTTVRDRHWDPKYNGVNWQAVHAELRPKIEKVDSAGEARSIMTDMIGRLKQTHFAIIPAEAYDHLEPGQGGRDGVAGLDVRLIDGKIIVTGVDKDSAAEAAGIRSGWEILAVDGNELAPSTERILKLVEMPGLRAYAVRASVLYRLGGAVGSEVKLKLRAGDERTLELAVSRSRERGGITRIGHLPPIHFRSEFRKVDGVAGYLGFNAFLDPESFMKTVSEGINACGKCSGFVVDMRGNMGGIGGLAPGLMGWFVEAKGLRMGTLYFRDGSLKLLVYPRPVTFQGPVAVLIDDCSVSAAEFFAGGMKDLKRARLFGTRTVGAALPSIIEKLPNGDGFQYAIANYISEGGKPLEGDGVTPDVEVQLTREALLAGRDPALDAAVAWIKQQK